MTTKLKAELERVIDDFIQDNCEDEGIPEGMFYPELATDMASAAEAVFDASFNAQQYAKKETA